MAGVKTEHTELHTGDVGSASEEQRQARYKRIEVTGNLLCYEDDDSGKPGVYIAPMSICNYNHYFEIEIKESGRKGAIGIGLVPYTYSLKFMPGWGSSSVGWHADDGKLFKEAGLGKMFGPRCQSKDRMGCGIRENLIDVEENTTLEKSTIVYFTKNMQEIGTVTVPYSPEELYPAVGMHSDGEEVVIDLNTEAQEDNVDGLNHGCERVCELSPDEMKKLTDFAEVKDAVENNAAVRLKQLYKEEDAGKCTECNAFLLQSAIMRDFVECLGVLWDKGANIHTIYRKRRTPLHYAACYGSIKCLNFLLDKQKDDVNAKDKYSWTPLHLAAKVGSKECVESLLRVNAEVDARDAKGLTPIHFAATSGRIECVELLVKKNNAIVNAKDNDGRSPIHYAARNESETCINHLIEKGADVNDRDNDGRSPIHYAARNESEACIKHLIEKGADVNDRDNDGRSPIHYAARNESEACIKHLIEKGADVNDRDEYGLTTLHFAAASGSKACIDIVLQSGGDIKAGDFKKHTPLHMAASSGSQECIEYLLSKGANVNERDSLKWSPLHFAVWSKSEKSIKCLLSNGAEVNLGDNDNDTPLHFAVYQESVRCVELLVEKNADINTRNNSGLTALNIAVNSNKEEIVKGFLRAVKKNRNVSAHPILITVADSGNEKMFKSLLDMKPDLSPRSEKEQTVFHHLVSKDQHDRIKLLELLLRHAMKSEPRNQSVNTANGDCDNEDSSDDEDFWSSKQCLKHVTGLRGKPMDQSKSFSSSKEEPKVYEMLLKDENLLAQICRNLLHRERKEVTKDDSLMVYLQWLVQLEDETSSDFADDPAADPTDDLELLDTFLKWLYCAETDEKYLTAMHMLLEEKPDIALKVLDWSLIRRNKYIQFNYTLLDRSTSFNQEDASGDGKREENHPLMLLVKKRKQAKDNKQIYDRLSCHPVVKRLVARKWQRIGMIVHVMNLLFYMLFLAMYTACIVSNTPADITSRESNVSRNVEDMASCSFQEDYLLIVKLKYFVVALSALHLLKELCQAIINLKSYLKTAENYLEIFVYAASILFVLNFSKCEDKGHREEWQWYVGTISIFFAWTNLLFFAKKVGSFGIYVLLFTRITYMFVTSICFIAIVLIIAFGLAFHCLFKKLDDFATVGRAIFKTTAMLIGELDFSAILVDNKPQFYKLSLIFYGVFMLIMTVVVMNLMVGLAVEDVKDIRKSASAENTDLQIDFVLWVEGPFLKVLKILPKWKCFRPFRKLVFPCRTEETLINKLSEKQIENIKAILRDDENNTSSLYKDRLSKAYYEV